MKQHAFFDLFLPDDETVADALLSDTITRTTLHEWPLSCVERICTADGRTAICKSMAGPLVEPHFYRTVHADFMVDCRILHQDDHYAQLLLTEAPGTRVDRLGLSPGRAQSLAQQVTASIRTLPNDAPIFLDLSTVEKWHALVENMCTCLDELVNAGDFGHLGQADVALLRTLCLAPAIADVHRREPGLIHGDLTGDNLFVDGERITVIDWQFPRRGPRAVDMATLLLSLGLDPRPAVPPGAVGLVHLLRIDWFIQCTQRWFPPGRATYARRIKENLVQAAKILGEQS